MDTSSLSVLAHRRSKPQGKVRRRVQDLRIPSSCYGDFTAVRPVLDLSHNESVRLAVDSLLSWGLQGYQEVLNAEGEADFLSESEKMYILRNGKEANAASPGESDGDDDSALEAVSTSCQSATLCPAVTTGGNPAEAGSGHSSIRGFHRIRDEPSIEVFFQSDGRGGAGMKDLVREFIRKATVALAIVMDNFTDVELLCDLLEASRKRNLSVHLLLDHLNLNLFVTMWQDLKLNSKNFPKLSVRSIDGQTYCARTGRKLTGQVAESFIITDWAEALTGSYSFSWLSWQVHRSLAVLVKGSKVTPFHQEFERLYSSSKPVPGFVTFISVPHSLPLFITSHAARDDNTDHKTSRSRQANWALPGDAPKTKTTANMPLSSNPKSPELECSSTYQSTLVTNSHLDHDNPVTGGLSSQQRSRNSLTRPSGTTAGPGTQTAQRNLSLNPKPKVELKSDGPKVQSPPTSQQKQAKRGLQFLMNPSRGLTSGLQTKFCSAGTRRQYQHQSQQQPPVHSQPPTEAPRSSASAGTRPQTRPGLLSPGAGARLSLQQANPPPRLNWVLQAHTARPRPVARTTSFDATYGSGLKWAGQPGWRPAPADMNALLMRSKSLTERRTAGLNGAGRNPNMTKT